MGTFYVGIIFFLFVLATFDLLVGVSNDAVNFLNSSLGCKSAKFKTILIVAAIGVFIGASFSNGMMDIARHGIMHPDLFSFFEVICVFLAVMVTDVVLLDIFNTLGMPTSTTVSMVFELLGGSFIIAIIKLISDNTDTLSFGDLINTEKALSVILGIFVSVMIAFVFGTIVQFFVRTIFTFNYKAKLKYLAGIYGGFAATCIIYFMLIKGLKNATFMTPETIDWVKNNTIQVIIGCFLACFAIMQVLYMFGVNILKIVVLMGTFALAVAFAGNDLVNFIGVPLASYSAYTDFAANGAGNANDFLMGSLNSSAKTPIGFLIAAGAIMVFALVTSKKAQNVTKTELGLSKQTEGDEMFGSSALARSIVRGATSVSKWLDNVLPKPFLNWLSTRFNTAEADLPEGAMYDEIRASVNLVLASLLIALGTSLKLPLSTTYVTFIVAMGTSLSDKAWGRDTAVFRITGMFSVIGGWFITAAAAFCACALVTMSMYFGGALVMIFFIVLAIFILIRSNISYSKKMQEKADSNNLDSVFNKMVRSKDENETLTLLKEHARRTNTEMLEFSEKEYTQITEAFFNEDLKTLRQSDKDLRNGKELAKKYRHRELVGLRHINQNTALMKNTWFHLYCNSNYQMLYCLRRLCDPLKEHIDNNFTPLDQTFAEEFSPIREQVSSMLKQSQEIESSGEYTKANDLLIQADVLKDKISEIRHRQENRMQLSKNISAELLYLNMLQESQELISAMRHQLRACNRFQA